MAKKKSSGESDQEAAGQESGSPKNFEEGFAEIQAIVSRLERGGDSLDEAIADYAKAVKLLGKCRAYLDKAERKVELLSGIDANGNPITEPFGDEDPDSAAGDSGVQDLEAKLKSRSRRRSSPDQNPNAGNSGSSLFD